MKNILFYFVGVFCLCFISTITLAQSFNKHKKKYTASTNTFKKIPNKQKSNYHLNKNIFSATAKLKNDNRKAANQSACMSQAIYRQINGSCNNISEETKEFFGRAQIPFKRFMPDVYNENSDLVGEERSHPRAISNIIFKAESDIPSNNLSSFVFTWGQFLDHDMIITPTEDEDEENISVLPNDIITSPIPFNRSATQAGTGINGIARQQMNFNTAWIDGSNVYGSDIELANELRTFKNGKLKTAVANNGEPILPLINGQFLAGDERALEQPGLSSLHILFLREHNRICDALLSCGLTNDEEIYQQARKKVGALIQSITYNEFLPALGIQLPNYEGYDNTIEPNILNVFATAAFRLGHTMVTDELLLYNNKGELVETLSLAEAFFNPSIIQEKGIESILNGLAQQFQQKVDAKVVESLRSFLFGAPPNAGLDLVALNIQRGRDHGLADYNAYRTAFGIKPAIDFRDITRNMFLQSKLKIAYNDDVNNIDVWVGLLSEDHLPNASVGQTLHAMLFTQFTALRDGDFYFYKNDPALSENEKRNIDNTRLSDVIKRNTQIKNIKYHVFYGPCNEDMAFDCELDETVCHCTSSEICNQGNCEPIIDSETCTCVADVELINQAACAVKVFSFQSNIKKYLYTIEPGQSFIFNSFKDKVYTMQPFNDSSDKQFYFVTHCDKQSYNINFENCTEEENCEENSVEENDINAIYSVHVFNEIKATNIVFPNAKVNYRAGNKIVLKPGFKAKKGSFFNARINDFCTNNRIDEYDNSVKTNEKESLIQSIFPNPTKEIVTLNYQLTKKTKLHITVHNAAGKKLNTILKGNQNEGKYNLNYNIQHLSAGIYYLTFNTPSLVNTQKLIIHR